MGGLKKKQLLIQGWLNDNAIWGDKALNWRQVDYLFVIQKRLELMTDHTLVHETIFLYSIYYETFEASIHHCKDISTKRNYIHLPILVTRIIRFIEPSIALEVETRFCIEKKKMPEIEK